MITLKLWNSLSDETRHEIGRFAGFGVRDRYHHNFDYDITGSRIKKTLECCNLQKDGTINVVVSLAPKYDEEPKKSISKALPNVKVSRTEELLKRLDKSLTLGFSTLISSFKEFVASLGKEDARVLNYTRGECNWNHNIDGVWCYKGKVWVNVYWQGDSTDGHDCVELSKIESKLSNGSNFVIPAQTMFEGYTRTIHSDIRISKDELVDYIKLVVKTFKDGKK